MKILMLFSFVSLSIGEEKICTSDDECVKPNYCSVNTVPAVCVLKTILALMIMIDVNYHTTAMMAYAVGMLMIRAPVILTVVQI